jgi:glutamate/tyrosine decarboxylase-like PLP-dependent enzyme
VTPPLNPPYSPDQPLPYPLEPDRDEMLSMLRSVEDTVVDFVEGLPKAPSIGPELADPLRADLLAPPADEPKEFAGLLDHWRQAASHAVETAGPSYLAYIPGGGVFTAALAELLAQSFNRYTGVSALAQGPVAIEHGVLRWLCDVFGLPEGSSGLVTTGGSLATLSALVAARHDRLGEEFADGTLYVTEHTHRCVAKAARIAGFRDDQLRTVAITSERRIDLDDAARLIAADRAAGRRPFAVVGTAGTTDTGAVDDLVALARLSRREELWFHVDGAYGGFFQLTARGRERLAGIEAADSIVLDPHKGLFLPYGTGVVLVRAESTLRAPFASRGQYLQDLSDDEQLPDYADLGPELTRDYRGLRLWLPLHLHGVAAFRQALDEKLDLAIEAHDALAADDRIQVAWRPDLTVVVFSLRDGDEAAHQEWLRRINASGRIFISSTRVDGRYVLRLCVLCHRTHADRIREAVDIIRRTVP